MKDNKGFTLIELLAVIIILGILILIAIPSMTKYIADSRKETYIDTARQYIKSTITFVNQGKLDMFDTDTTYYIPSTCIKLESGGDSPYGKFNPAYIVVTYDNNSYKYYWLSTDTSGMGIKNITLNENLDVDMIETGVKSNDIKTNVGVGTRSKISVMSNDCKSFDTNPVVDSVPDGGTVVTSRTKTCRTAACGIESQTMNTCENVACGTETRTERKRHYSCGISYKGYEDCYGTYNYCLEHLSESYDGSNCEACAGSISTNSDGETVCRWSCLVTRYKTCNVTTTYNLTCQNEACGYTTVYKLCKHPDCGEN